MNKLVKPKNSASKLPGGSVVALITPFTADGAVDWAKSRRLIDFHIESGTAAIAVAGTTGESSTLSHVEHCDLIAATVEYGAGRIHVMAGVGANSTFEAVALARFASDRGANSLLSVVPYFVKPSQQGLMDHFTAQADAVDVTIVLYDVLGRTVTDLSVSTFARLSGHHNIRGPKDATGDLARAAEMFEALSSGFAHYSGDDLTSMPFLALGGCGVISVVANVLPKHVAGLCRLVERAELRKAQYLFLEMQPLTLALFAETSPSPVKFAGVLLGQCEPTVHLLLVLPEESTRQLLRDCLEEVVRHAA